MSHFVKALSRGTRERRQSPAELAELWDPRTLASFAVSQLDAFGRIVDGSCPLLSRAVNCRGGWPRGRRRPRRWKELIASYLDEEAELARRQAVGMMRHVWRNYEARAWGKDELKPISGTGGEGWGSLGMTLVDSLDTLWLMGLREEFDRGVSWVEEHLSFDKDMNVNLFETSIRQLGGLVAAYSLSKRTVLLVKAEELGSRLLRAYGTMGQPQPSASPGKSRKGGASSAKKKALSGPSKALSELLKSMGQDFDALLGVNDDDESVLEALKVLEEASPDIGLSEKPQMPFSDVNLLTGDAQNLGGFVSLAEAYVPLEFKALAMFTGNCTYSNPHDEVLRLVNRSHEFTSRGLAPILLKGDGNAFPSQENRISLGSRGDSFYEYLLKDWIFTGKDQNPPSRSMWDSFRMHLPNLFVEVDPAQASRSTVTSVAAPLSALVSRWNRRRTRRRQTKDIPSERPVPPVPPHHRKRWQGARRGGGGALGGWYESASDAVGPWLFVREVGWQQSIAKMDHLICFLPGALALDVFHNSGVQPDSATARLDGNITLMPPERASELFLAHKLMQTCVHMYFRTVSDLAPEITRFDGFGLVDDAGSMHNILRPESIESIFILWRSTKSQIYRNWGRRMLSAFDRMKVAYGYACMHNVNAPWDRRDDMPSFFLAETVKYLFMLFSDDSVLPLRDTVLNTEAHPMPTAAAAGGSICGVGRGPSQAERAPTTSTPQPSEAGVGEKGRKGERPKRGTLKNVTPARGKASVESGSSPGSSAKRASAIEGKYTAGAATASEPLETSGAAQHCMHTLVGDDGACQTGLDHEPGEAVSPQGVGVADAGSEPSTLYKEIPPGRIPQHAPQARIVPVASASKNATPQHVVPRPQPVVPHPLRPPGNPICWDAIHTFEMCCLPPPTGNPECWDAEFTFGFCCSTSSG